MSNRDNSKKLSIEIAAELLASVLVIAHDYKDNKNHDLTEIEVKMMEMFLEELKKTYTIALYISQCLHRRMNGEYNGFE